MGYDSEHSPLAIADIYSCPPLLKGLNFEDQTAHTSNLLLRRYEFQVKIVFPNFRDRFVRRPAGGLMSRPKSPKQFPGDS